MFSSQYEISGRDIVSEKFDDDIVVLDLKSGKYFSFTDSGCALWEALSNGVKPELLVRSEANFSGADLEAFIQKLLEHNLVVARKSAAEAALSAEILQKISAAKELPDIFVFDDLAELFLADPIHDVEEPVGWPAVKPA
jgi:hypothetical protein